MSVLSRYEKLVEESKNALPALLRPFQYQTQILLELGRHVLVSVPTGQGKDSDAADRLSAHGRCFILYLSLVFLFQSEDAVALVIPPTVMIEQQMEGLLVAWGIKYINLGKISSVSIANRIEKEKPNILLSNIERLEDSTVQSALLSVRLRYVAIDELQVSIGPILGASLSLC